MRKTFLVILGFLLCSLPARATTYTVKAAGGGDYTTIQACITGMASGGDTCTVYVGTYAETPTLKAGGVGNYNVVTVNVGDTVNVLGFVMASHTKLNGFVISHSSAPFGTACVAVPSGSTDEFITNNTMSYCGANGGTEEAMLVGQHSGSTGSTFIYVQGNTLFHGCSAVGVNDVCENISIGSGNHWLIEGNDLSHNDDTIEFYGSFIVARNNAIHDVNPGVECNSGSHGGNCHADQFETEPSASVAASQHNLFEGNTFKNTPSDTGTIHGLLMQGDACGGNCFHTIVRFNLYYELPGYYMLNDISASSFPNVKSYNESLSEGGPGDLMGNWAAGPGTSAMINMLVYGFVNSTSGSYYYSSPIVANNLINPATSPFANANSDWRLATGSAAIGAGTFLTTAVGMGSSSTSLTVADPWYFQDGWGFPAGTGLGQMSPDWIRIGASTTVQIANGGINYSTGVITLANAVSWSNGDGIYLYKKSDGVQVLNGASPNQGFDQGTSAAPHPPTSLSIIVP